MTLSQMTLKSVRVETTYKFNALHVPRLDCVKKLRAQKKQTRASGNWELFVLSLSHKASKGCVCQCNSF